MNGYFGTVPTVKVIHTIELPKVKKSAIFLGFVGVGLLIKSINVLDKRLSKLEKAAKEQADKVVEETEDDLCSDLEEEFLK